MSIKGSGSGINPAAMTTAAALEAKAATLLLEDGSIEEWMGLCFEAVNRARYAERLGIKGTGSGIEPGGNVIPFRRRRRGTGS